MNYLEILKISNEWLNNNEGTLTLILFIITILFGWISGIFNSLRRKPKFKIEQLEDQNYYCIFETGKIWNNYPEFRIGIALYISISNIGSAPSSIKRITVGYRNHSILFNRFNWLVSTVSLRDFAVNIGEDIKVYPFLLQKNYLSKNQPDNFLEIGKSVLGIVYFEQKAAWGNYQAKIKNNSVKIKIGVEDIFGKVHYQVNSIPVVSIEYARQFNPEFGNTFIKLQNHDN